MNTPFAVQPIDVGSLPKYVRNTPVVNILHGSKDGGSQTDVWTVTEMDILLVALRRYIVEWSHE